MSEIAVYIPPKMAIETVITPWSKKPNIPYLSLRILGLISPNI